MIRRFPLMIVVMAFLAGSLPPERPVAQAQDIPVMEVPEVGVPALGPDFRLQSPGMRATVGVDPRRRPRPQPDILDQGGLDTPLADSAGSMTGGRAADDERTSEAESEPLDVAMSPTTMRRAPGEERDPEEPREYGRLIVMTTFEGVDVTVEGTPYPSESMEGVRLVAGEQYEVVIAEAATGDETTAGRSRTITLRLEPGETRILMANSGLDNATGTASSRTTRPPRESRRSEEGSSRSSDEESESGFLGVSSSPRGTVYVDGENTGQTTPARRIEIEPGRHEVRVFYEEAERFSETKNVLIRAGVNTNVFFRDRQEDHEEPEASESNEESGD